MFLFYFQNVITFRARFSHAVYSSMVVSANLVALPVRILPTHCRFEQTNNRDHESSQNHILMSSSSFGFLTWFSRWIRLTLARSASERLHCTSDGERGEWAYMHPLCVFFDLLISFPYDEVKVTTGDQLANEVRDVARSASFDQRRLYF